MSQWVNPRAVDVVRFASRFQAPSALPDDACGCWAGRRRRWGSPHRSRPRSSATVLVGEDGAMYAVPCSRCGGTGVVP